MNVERIARRLGVTLIAAVASTMTFAADGAPKPSSATAQQRADKAKGMALATETTQRISEAQLQIADRVLTGEATC